jgi:hypothetical protein
MSEQLDLLLAAIHGVSADDARSLSAEDLGLLVTIVQDPASDLRLRAMSILTRAAPIETVDVMSGILAAPFEDPIVRAAAAAHLGALGGSAASVALVAIVPTLARDEASLSIRHEVALALGKIGDTDDALDALGLLVDDPSPSVARQARFGQTLIAFRGGIAGFEPQIPNFFDLAAPVAEDAQPILVRADADVVDAITSLQEAGDTFGVALGTDGAHRVQCLDFELALLLDQTVLASGLPALATTRPVLAGLVALHDEASDTWSTRWLVLVFPIGPAINVALHRRDGKQVMFGAGVSDTITLGFALRGVRDTGNAPVQFDGRFSGVALAVDAAASGLSLFSQNSPEPFDLL